MRIRLQTAACTAAFGLALLGCSPSKTAAAPTPAASQQPATAAGLSDGKTAVDLALGMPEVKAYCASLEKAPQPSHCTMWSEDERAPTTRCKADASYLDDCLWPVYLGESHPDHAVRFATIWVNLTSNSVAAVSDFACGQMPLATWRAWRIAVAAAPDNPPECPEGGK